MAAGTGFKLMKPSRKERFDHSLSSLSLSKGRCKIGTIALKVDFGIEGFEVSSRLQAVSFGPFGKMAASLI